MGNEFGTVLIRGGGREDPREQEPMPLDMLRLGGQAGTPERPRADAPALPASFRRSPAMPSIEPFHRSGSPVEALAFTGRGLTMVVGRQSFLGDATKIFWRFTPPVPFRGFVRSVGYQLQTDSDPGQIIPVWSESLDEVDTGVEGAAKFPKMFAWRDLGNAAVPPGIDLVMGGVYQWMPLNFLLPSSGLYVGVGVWIVTASELALSVMFEVLEVVPRGS